MIYKINVITDIIIVGSLNKSLEADSDIYMKINSQVIKTIDKE